MSSSYSIFVFCFVDYPIIPALNVLQLKLQVVKINKPLLSVLKGSVFRGQITERACKVQ